MFCLLFQLDNYCTYASKNVVQKGSTDQNDLKIPQTAKKNMWHRCLSILSRFASNVTEGVLLDQLQMMRNEI